jgi:hypothetical protein
MPDALDHGISAGRKLPALTDANRFPSDCPVRRDAPRRLCFQPPPKKSFLPAALVDPLRNTRFPDRSSASNTLDRLKSP